MTCCQHPKLSRKWQAFQDLGCFFKPPFLGRPVAYQRSHVGRLACSRDLEAGPLQNGPTPFHRIPRGCSSMPSVPGCVVPYHCEKKYRFTGQLEKIILKSAQLKAQNRSQNSNTHNRKRNGNVFTWKNRRTKSRLAALVKEGLVGL